MFLIALRLRVICKCNNIISNIVFPVVVDMDDIDSITMAGTWKQDIVNNAVFTNSAGNVQQSSEIKLIPILLVGNKADKVMLEGKIKCHW